MKFENIIPSSLESQNEDANLICYKIQMYALKKILFNHSVIDYMPPSLFFLNTTFFINFLTSITLYLPFVKSENASLSFPTPPNLFIMQTRSPTQCDRKTGQMDVIFLPLREKKIARGPDVSVYSGRHLSRWSASVVGCTEFPDATA